MQTILEHFHPVRNRLRRQENVEVRLIRFQHLWRRRGGLEGFFWQCMASRVTMLCATWSSEQLLRGGDFVGLFRDIDVCQDETRFDVR